MGQPSITIMSTLNNPDIVSVSNVVTEGWTSVGPLIEVDMNTINSLKNKNGDELQSAESVQLRAIQEGISHLNYLQIEYVERMADLNKINKLKNGHEDRFDLYYIHYFNINNGGILENGLLFFNIDGGDDDFGDDDFTQYISDKEEYAERTGPMQYISQHALRNVEGRDISSIHKFPTHNLLRFIASWLNYGKASGANPADTDGAAQHGHEYGEMNNTRPSSVHPRVMWCSNYGVTRRTNGETYYSSTTHPSASALLEVVTQRRLIRLLNQRHDNHHLLTPVA